MVELIFLGLIAIGTLVALAVLGAIAAFLCFALYRCRLLQCRWHFMVCSILIMAAYPVWAIWNNHAQTEACIALYGPNELRCTGEIVGGFLSLLRGALFLGSFAVGPLVGSFLAKRVIRAPEEGL